MTFRPRRSVLYMPSSNAQALEKAKTIPVDGLILDLEDAVAPDAKPAAREAAAAAVRSGAYGERELTIRVNGLGTEWHDDDLVAAARPAPTRSSYRRSTPPTRSTGSSPRWRRPALPSRPRCGRWSRRRSAMLQRAARSPRPPTAPDRLVMGTNDLVKELYAEHVPGRAARCSPASASRCWPPAPPASRSSTASTTT